MVSVQTFIEEEEEEEEEEDDDDDDDEIGEEEEYSQQSHDEVDVDIISATLKVYQHYNLKWTSRRHDQCHFESVPAL